jgi:hypothetical protein
MRFTGPGYDFEIDIPEGWVLRQKEETYRTEAAVMLLSDLDRCEHGRHVGDICSGQAGCNGPSHGNQYLTPGFRIGTTMSGKPIIIPAIDRRSNLGDPALWLP